MNKQLYIAQLIINPDQDNDHYILGVFDTAKGAQDAIQKEIDLARKNDEIDSIVESMDNTFTIPDRILDITWKEGGPNSQYLFEILEETLNFYTPVGD